MSGRGRDKPDICLKILQADFGKRWNIRHRGDTRGGSDRQGAKLVAAYQLSDVGIARHHGRDVPAKRGVHRRSRSLVWNEVHREVHDALHRLDGDMRAGRWTGARNGQLTGRLLSSLEKLRERAVRRRAVDCNQLWRTDQITDRLESCDRIVVHFLQVRIDHKFRRRDQNGTTVRRGACDVLCANDVAGSRPVFDDHRATLLATYLIRQQPRQGVGTSARRGRRYKSYGRAGLRDRWRDQQDREQTKYAG